MFAALRRVSSQLASTSARAFQLAPIEGASSQSARGFSASSVSRGVEDFFGERYLAGSVPKDYPRAGRPWEAADLRAKSDEDLHKLWYVLLKEKNVLLTERLAARSQRERFLNPYRLRKVKQSMARLKTVVNERMRAMAGDPEKLMQYQLDLRSRLMPPPSKAAAKPAAPAAEA